MSGKSWKKMSVDYKDSKQPDIEEPETKYVKKKKKHNKRSKHKHSYIPAVYYNSYSGFSSNGKKTEYITCGSHCKKCGRVKDMIFMWSNTQDRVEKFKKEYPEYVEVHLPDEWDYFKDKCVPV